jgi:hypothetical protein
VWNRTYATGFGLPALSDAMVRERQQHKEGWTGSLSPAHPAFEAWLRADLARQHRDTLSEALPDSILSLLPEQERSAEP